LTGNSSICIIIYLKGFEYEKYILQSLIILAVGAVLGVVYNFLSPAGLPLFAAQDKALLVSR